MSPFSTVSDFVDNFQNDAQLNEIFFGEVSISRFLKVAEAHRDFILRQFGVVLSYFGVFGTVSAIFKSKCRILVLVFVGHTIVLDALCGRNPFDKFSNHFIQDQWLLSLGFMTIFIDWVIELIQPSSKLLLFTERKVIFNPHTPDRFTNSHARCTENCGSAWLKANSAKNRYLFI